MKVNKPSAITSKQVFDLYILNQWNGHIKVPVFLWIFGIDCIDEKFHDALPRQTVDVVVADF